MENPFSGLELSMRPKYRPLSPNEVARLCVLSWRAEKTVRKWWDRPEAVRPGIREQLNQLARKAGICRDTAAPAA